MFAVAGVVYVAVHLVIYEGLTAYAAGDHFVGGEFTAVGSEVNLWGRSTRLIGLLVDRGFGIGAWQPAFLIMPLVAGWAIARRRQHGVATALWLLVAGWLVATFVALTMHGWWFPGRQLVVVVPIAVLLVGVWVDEARSRRLRLIFALGLVGVVAFVFLAVEGLQESLTWVVDFGATANPFYRVLRAVLPDYMAPGTTTWVLHGVWTSVALVMGWLGWRNRAGESSFQAAESSNATNHERAFS
jgi:hypothetical protein